MSKPNPACFHVKAKNTQNVGSWVRKKMFRLVQIIQLVVHCLYRFTLKISEVSRYSIRYNYKKNQSQIPVYWYKPLHQKSWVYTLA